MQQPLPTATEYEPPRKLAVNLVLDTHIREALAREAQATGEDMSTTVRAILRQHFGLDRRRTAQTASTPAT